MNKRDLEFLRGVWFAIEYLVLQEDEPTAAIQIANAAGIGCQRAKALWKDSNMSDENSLMKRFLKEENFNKP